MAIFTITGGGLDLFHLDGRFSLFDERFTETSSTITGRSTFYGTPLTYQGSFTLNSQGNVTGGTVTKIIVGGKFEIEGFSVDLNDTEQLLSVVLGRGDDTVYGNESANFLNGENFFDANRDGRFGDDVLFGYGGDDVLWGGPGTDILDGGEGFDSLDTYHEISGIQVNLSREDLVFSELPEYAELQKFISSSTFSGSFDTKNFLKAETAYDSFNTVDTVRNIEGISGTDFFDVFVGNSDGGSLFGNGGEDILIATGGVNFLSGGVGNDFIIGHDLADIIEGGENNDVLFGRGGDDSIDGGAGDDIIHGGAGNDTITGGPGDDTMYGGSDADTFIIYRGTSDNHGNNVIYGGSSETDTLDFITDDFVDYGDAQRSLFFLSWQDQAGPGYQITLVHNDGTDVLHHITGVRWADGKQFTQKDIAEAGFLGHFAMAWAGAFRDLREAWPGWDDPPGPNPPLPGFKIFAKWLTIAENVALAGAEAAGQEDLEGAIRRAFVKGAEVGYDFVAEQTRGFLDDVVLNKIPEQYRNEINTRLDEVQNELRGEISERADELGTLYADGSQQVGQAIGSFLFELLESMSSSVESKYQELLPGQKPIDDFQNNFDIDEIILDSKYAPEPLLTPRPETPREVEPTEEKETIILNSLASSIKGTLEQLDGDTIYNFWLDDVLIFEGVTASKQHLKVTMRSAILEFDIDLDGEVDATVTLIGDFKGAEFKLDNVDDSTQITFEFPLLNTVPLAVNDFFATRTGQTLTVSALDGLLANDSDPDGDPIVVIAFNYTGTGTLAVFADGQFSYTPAPGFTGSESFTYTIADSFGAEDSATVTLHIDEAFSAQHLLSGVVTMRDSAGPVDAEVIFRHHDGSTLTAQTADDGTFSFLLDEGAAGTLEVQRDYQPGSDPVPVINDVLALFRMVVGVPGIDRSPQNIMAGDYNQDGATNITDVLALFRFLVGVPDSPTPTHIFLDDAEDYAGVTMGEIGAPRPIEIGPIAVETNLALTGIMTGNLFEHV